MWPKSHADGSRHTLRFLESLAAAGRLSEHAGYTGTELEIIPTDHTQINGADAERLPSVHTNARTDLEFKEELADSGLAIFSEGLVVPDHPGTDPEWSHAALMARNRRVLTSLQYGNHVKAA